MTTFHLYASHNDVDITSVLGKPDYSYWFVQSYFERALKRLGDTHIVLSLKTDLPHINSDSEMLLAFMPPHKVPASVVDFAIPVFAWEYDTIPDEPWFGETKNDWYSILERSPGAMTHCDLTVQTVKKRMGQDYPIAAVHVPVWEQYSSLRVDKPVAEWTLSGRGMVIDSRNPTTFGHLDLLRRGESEEEAAVSDLKVEPEDFELEFSGVVYAAVFNPNDGRKEWVDMLSAFISAHRNNRDATLLLKLIHVDFNHGAPVVYDVAAHIGDFDCRVVVVQGHLDDESYGKLCAWSTFAVNSSRGEGQCLPLLESMSAGVPAVAPDHTAMADYVRPTNSFVVDHTRKLASWSHDPRMKYRCFTYPVVWESLRDKFVESFAVATGDHARYLAMCDDAQTTTRKICSVDAVYSSLVEFFDEVRKRQERLS